ncbi:Fe-S cluster assembly protein SufD [Devosia sp. 63-57]|uniref:Fe-S cluster assembly protein SufD n=1 Tax=Devosia sp. 63-57 TaxID=1895751 RepID=UPI00086F3B06|nr:Fe-S cluster assembly protein SufD [Devosia sp. 63-57]ODT49218.1 MAG: Fe-S cluster assembly protein SufD [Pelagibacterium sp. SCN 63-126]OJX43479.1 MAG: Fe-S cluster assembly protein SufD [Devosia sp. 63-57]
MRPNFPVRLGSAEETLIAQLKAVGADQVAERITVAGLPTRRVEAYHYTDLKTLLRAVPARGQPANEASAPALRVPGAFNLMVANGVIQNASTAPAGVIVGQAHGGVLTTRDDVIVNIGNALAKTALTLTLEGSVDPVIQIERRIEGEAAHVADALKVFVADGAAATILETFSGSDAAHVGNHASYIALGKNAVLTHITLDLSASGVSHFATNEYHLADGAKLRTLIIHAGASLARTQLFPTLGGAEAHADITGLNLVSDGQHADITMETTHAVPHTSSQPLFKSITRGRSKSVIQGKLIVARDAQKTDAKFMHQGLMLSDDAEILSKPELEIYADDVVCGHGSTCGKLDEDSLFYLLSRGIPKAEAETMLVRGFIAELLDPVEDEALNEALQGVVDGWLLGQ